MRNKIERNYVSLKKLVLEECLGDYSTAEMSKKLGFSFDKYKRWLDNTKIFRWDEFINVCEMVELDVKSGLEILRLYDGNDTLFAHLKMRYSFETNQEVASYLKCHVSVVKRYISGETTPDVETIFKMVDFNSNYLASFFYSLFSGKVKNPEFELMINEEIKAPFFKMQRSIIPIIDSCFKLEAYKKRTTKTPEWLSEILETPLEEIQFNLTSMIEAGTVTFDGDDTYTMVDKSTNTQVVGFEKNIPFFQSLNYRAIESLEKKIGDPNSGPAPGIIGVQVYAASAETSEKIHSTLIKAFADVYKLIEEDKGPHEEVFCLIVETIAQTKKSLS